MKKTVIFLLVLVMLFGVFAGCSGSKNNETPTSAPGTDSTPQGDPESEENRYRPEQKNYDSELRMLTEVESFYYHAYTYELDSNPKEICDIAIAERQNQLLEKFGIEMKRVHSQDDSAKANQDLFNNAMQIGDDICDVVCFTGIRTMTAAVNGWLLDINKISELNLDASYWDQRIQKEYQIGDTLFALEGDFDFIDDLRTYVVIYNDTRYQALQLADKYGTPYELSANGKWTYEIMMEMAELCGRFDEDANGVYDEKDSWGYVSENSAPYYFFLGSGNKLVNNREGTLNVVFDDPSTSWDAVYSMIEKLMSINQSTATIVANRSGSFNDSSDTWATASNIFMYNRALFRSTSLSAVLRLLDMEDDYGIMPIPAYQEGQDGYYCWVSPVNCYPLSFPHTAKGNISKVASMVETMAYYSLYGPDSLNVAFYDLLAYARLCRKPEDKQMLQLVFESKTFDIDTAMGITDAESIIKKISDTQQYDVLYSDFDAMRTNGSAATNLKNTVSLLMSNLARQESGN